MSDMLNLSPGIWPNIPEDVYHKDLLCEVPTLSCSMAKVLIGESPLHAWAQHSRLGNKVHRESTAEQEYFQAVHKLCLGKGAELAVCDADTWQTKDAREFRKDARASGQLPILAHKLGKAQAQCAALHTQLVDFGLHPQFMAALPEVVIIYDDGSVRCRAMLDKLYIDENAKKAVVFDVKNCDSANPAGLGRTIFQQDYDLQNYSYSQAVGLVRPDLAGRVDFIFLFTETEYPFCVTPVRLTGEQLMLGTSKWTRAWQMWESCLKNNSWPSYGKEIVTTEAPGYALASEMGKNPIMP